MDPGTSTSWQAVVVRPQPPAPPPPKPKVQFQPPPKAPEAAAGPPDAPTPVSFEAAPPAPPQAQQKALVGARQPRQISDYDLIDQMGLAVVADLVTVSILAIIIGTLLYAVMLRCLRAAYGSTERERDAYRDAEKLAADLISRTERARVRIEGVQRQIEVTEAEIAEFMNRWG
jgi:hypothetical protein